MRCSNSAVVASSVSPPSSLAVRTSYVAPVSPLRFLVEKSWTDTPENEK